MALRVLIADDNRDNADSLAMLVGVWGHEVRVAYDGAAALVAATDFRPDVMIVDLVMPELDGRPAGSGRRPTWPAPSSLQ